LHRSARIGQPAAARVAAARRSNLSPACRLVQPDGGVVRGSRRRHVDCRAADRRLRPRSVAMPPTAGSGPSVAAGSAGATRLQTAAAARRMRVAVAARLLRPGRRGAEIAKILGEILEGRSDCWCGGCSLLAGTGNRFGSPQA